MRQDFLDTLHCPYTGSRFVVGGTSAADAAGIKFGWVTSEAGDFPIIDGILRLPVDELRAPIVQLIRDGKLSDATSTALELPYPEKTAVAVNQLFRAAYRTGFSPAAGLLMAPKRRLQRITAEGNEPLATMAARIKTGLWADWQVYRFSMPTFLPVYPLLNVLKTDGPLLDFGCGMGHGAFLISRIVPARQIVCADHSFFCLYMARKFFASEASFVCLDGDYPLPFSSSYFASVFSSDAVHCMDSKLALTQEFRRVARHEAVLVLAHLHSKLSPQSFGKSLTPDGYRRLFDGVPHRLVPEDVMVKEFVENGNLDLAREYTSAELNRPVPGLSLVASHDAAVFRRYDSLWNRQVARMKNPIVNPIYRTTATNGGAHLQKRSPVVSAGHFSTDYLPESITLNGAGWPGNGVRELQQSQPERFAELARQFVLVDAPERFV